MFDRLVTIGSSRNVRRDLLPTEAVVQETIAKQANSLTARNLGSGLCAFCDDVALRTDVRSAFWGLYLHAPDSTNVRFVLQVQVLSARKRPSCAPTERSLLAETDESIPRAGARSPGSYSSIPRLIPRHVTCRLHPSAPSPDHHRAVGAIQCTSVHVRARHVVEQPPRGLKRRVVN